jgi:acetyl-CoA acetyltransferase
MKNAFIPYRAYWSTPFCRWQGQLAESNSIELAARTTRRFLEGRKIAADAFDAVVLGTTVPQRSSFYGAPWLAGMIGAPHLTGPTVSQACATSARALLTAVLEVEAGLRNGVLVVTADRTSNGPHMYYPSAGGPGGKGEAEDWVWDNFNRDPYGGTSMLDTAENVAREAKVSRTEQEEMTLLRYRQYDDAIANDRAFQRRYMVAAEIGRGKKTTLVEADEGVFPTTREGLAGLKPLKEGGSVTFGAQTHPADGNAGLIVASAARAAALSADPAVRIGVVGFGDARVEKSFMPMAVVPAARNALAAAGIAVADLKAVKTHNPFAINDVYFSREMGIKPDAFNRYGSSLVYGHPQGPTGLRALIELIEELVIAGGGYGLFSGCAAGDTAMATVIRVG